MMAQIALKFVNNLRNTFKLRGYNGNVSVFHDIIYSSSNMRFYEHIEYSLSNCLF